MHYTDSCAVKSAMPSLRQIVAAAAGAWRRDDGRVLLFPDKAWRGEAGAGPRLSLALHSTPASLLAREDKVRRGMGLPHDVATGLSGGCVVVATARGRAVCRLGAAAQGTVKAGRRPVLSKASHLSRHDGWL